MTSSRPFKKMRRALIAGAAAFLIATTSLGVSAYSLLKPTEAASAPIASVATNLATDQTVYTIQSQASQVRFVVDEVLRGSPYTVVGTTDQVAGQISFDAANPSTAQVGTIVIDARTLATDDSSRNRALGNQILSTSQYEYITFTPTQLTGLPSSVTTGDQFSFQLTGDLSIKGVSRPATFNVTATPSQSGQLTGTATTTIQYADWGITIPSVPFVASVDNQVALQLDFGATATA